MYLSSFYLQTLTMWIIFRIPKNTYSFVMKYITLLLIALFTTTVFAKNTPSYAEPDERTLVEHHHYRNVNGRTVHSPAHTKNGKKPAGASAKCRDGSYSFSKHHRGTCSRHHGVAAWYK